MRANIPKGMGGGPQNMQAMLRQAQKMQEDMAAKQEELDAREYDISAGGGVVNVKINGKKEILAIDLKPEIVDPDDIETLSDIIQIGSYKLRKKRVFKMAPIHHHFEMSGWSEWKIVIVFCLVGAIGAAISILAVTMI